jgi:hypothetical protein
MATGLSDLTHSPLFVKLNAPKGFGGGAFAFSNLIILKLKKTPYNS